MYQPLPRFTRTDTLFPYKSLFRSYKEVCAACHSIDLVHFRDLEGIGYNKAEVKAIAAQWVIEQPTINPDTGEASTRKNLPSDPFPKPFANDVAARAANNNALPPDQIGRAHV